MQHYDELRPQFGTVISVETYPKISSCLIILDRGTVCPSEWKVRKGIDIS
jgi:hypothetical protein